MIGQTVTGQDISAVRVTKDSRRPKDGKKPTTVYMGAQHAREWITPEMVRRLLDLYVTSYGTDERITDLVDDTELWFIPVANPDGELGTVSLIVTGKTAGRTAAVAIKQTGAKAYRGVQAYWFADGDSYDGIEVTERPDWAFCLEGSTPLVARTDRGRQQVVLPRLQRARGVSDAFGARMDDLRKEGWDGVFFDRGFAALTGRDDAKNPTWNKVSTCTEDPVKPDSDALGRVPRARFAGEAARSRPDHELRHLPVRRRGPDAARSATRSAPRRTSRAAGRSRMRGRSSTESWTKPSHTRRTSPGRTTTARTS